MTARVVHVEDVAPQPWDNGGGETRELLRSDDGAWRMSLAAIERDGAFSTFPGRRRLLTVVDGPVLVLSVDGSEHVVEPRRPFAFDGGAAATAAVPEGEVRILNVITDPAAVSAFVTVLELGRGSTLPLGDDQAALMLHGKVSVEGVDAGVGCLAVGPADVVGRATLAVITISRLGS